MDAGAGAGAGAEVRIVDAGVTQGAGGVKTLVYQRIYLGNGRFLFHDDIYAHLHLHRLHKFAVPANSQQVPAVKKTDFLRTVWEFTRPHTIIGSALSVWSIHFFAAASPGPTSFHVSPLPKPAPAT